METLEGMTEASTTTVKGRWSSEGLSLAENVQSLASFTHQAAMPTRNVAKFTPGPEGIPFGLPWKRPWQELLRLEWMDEAADG